jgi:putative hydrolase of the HAD superfamily
MNAKPPAESHLSSPDSRAFSHVDTWIFDLDNTLYPHTSQVWPQIDDRITLYIAHLFGLDGMSARALQKFFYHKYGTTLRALIDEYDIDPHDFLDFAHDIDHADIVAKKIGILDHFEDVFDIAASNFVPKPDRRAYEIFLERHAVEPSRAAMFEDIAKNLAVPHDLGMTTTLIVPKTIDPFRESFEQEAVRTPDIDYITNDLADFLRTYALPAK